MPKKNGGQPNKWYAKKDPGTIPNGAPLTKGKSSCSGEKKQVDKVVGKIMYDKHKCRTYLAPNLSKKGKSSVSLKFIVIRKLLSA